MTVLNFVYSSHSIFTSLACTLTGCPRRSYKVLKGLIFVFPFIRLLERSYFSEFCARGLIKSLVLNANDFFGTFLNQQTCAFRYISAFHLFDKTLCTKINVFFQHIQKCVTVLILREQGLRKVLFLVPRKVL